MENTFQPGDEVEIIAENGDIELPDEVEAEHLGAHGFAIGSVFTIPDDVEGKYDGWDNSWLLRDEPSLKRWVHEGCLRLLPAPITQDEEDEAMASILKALEGSA